MRGVVIYSAHTSTLFGGPEWTWTGPLFLGTRTVDGRRSITSRSSGSSLETINNIIPSRCVLCAADTSSAGERDASDGQVRIGERAYSARRPIHSRPASPPRSNKNLYRKLQIIHFQHQYTSLRISQSKALDLSWHKTAQTVPPGRKSLPQSSHIYRSMFISFSRNL
jgi:hypothetical protein